MTRFALPLLLIVIGVLTYANSLDGRFIYDDGSAIEHNEHIRGLWPPSRALAAPEQSPVAGRPVVALTLALNYAFGELDVRGYHVLNIAVHLLCALVLYGIVRRTLGGERLRSIFGEAAHGIALFCALIWMLHPLQTECVNYLIQRTESIMGLFYLLTLYCAIRGAEPGPSWKGRLWYAASIVSCALGMASKESMVTAPLIVVLYDWSFRTGPFKEVVRRRLGLYVGLAATWVVLAALMATGPRSESVGFSLGVSWLRYAFNQCQFIIHYLRLVLWPEPLILDYGFARPLTVYEAAPFAAALGAILLATALVFVFRPAIAFPAVWSFVILAPTSSVVPIVTEVAAERRMYLPSAGVIVLIVVAVYLVFRALARRVSREEPRVRWAPWIGAALGVTVAGALAWQTSRRNLDYRDPVGLWEGAVAAVPLNQRAHINLADALTARGERDEAIRHLRQAVRLIPNSARAELSLGKALAAQGNVDDAILHFRKVIAARPDRPETYYYLALALQERGNVDEAIAFYRQALDLDPDYTEARRSLTKAVQSRVRTRYELANALVAGGDLAEAIDLYRQVLEHWPDDADVHRNLAIALGRLGRVDQAIIHLHEAIRVEPDDPEAHFVLAIALRSQGKADEAIQEFRRTVELDPDHASAHNNLGGALQTQGRIEEAIRHYERSLEAKPGAANVHHNLGLALRSQGRIDEAIVHLREAMALGPEAAQSHQALGATLVMAGRPEDAVESFRQAARLRTGWAQPLKDAAWILATHPDPNVRKPEEAVRLAERASDLTGRRDAGVLDTLAASYAAAGHFDLAVATAREALALASAHDPALAGEIRGRLSLYENGRPYRAPAPGTRSHTPGGKGTEASSFGSTFVRPPA